MANITASDVNKLRQQTGAGMMDCKKALVEAEGDFEKAIEILRKKGQKVAANRSDRDSSEGVALAKTNKEHTKSVLISLNCETDFVAKNQAFIDLANQFLDLALSSGVTSKDAFLNLNFGGISVAEKLTEQTGVIGEKIEIGNFEILEAPFVNIYIHAGNKIATAVGLSSAVSGAEDAAKNVAMQVAAMNPIALDESSVSPAVIEQEKRIAIDQLLQEGKPDMVDKILPGKLQRFYKDNTLVHQDYIKDSKISVSGYLKTVDKTLTITGFKRVALG